MDLFWLYFKLGYYHVLDWKAYDHVLFLIVLAIPYTLQHWKRVLWLVTAFTIGHTLSLMLSVYDIVRVNVAAIELLILITILVTAGFNIVTTGNKARKIVPFIMLLIALSFGLIHGIGFSYYFRQIIAMEDSKFIPLLEFALGIEAAQLILVFLVLLVSFVFQYVLKVRKRDWIIVVSAIVTGIVLPMLMERL